MTILLSSRGKLAPTVGPLIMTSRFGSSRMVWLWRPGSVDAFISGSPAATVSSTSSSR